MKPVIFNISVMRSSMLLGGMFFGALMAWVSALEPLPISSSYWKDPAFIKAFNGSYRIEARIEPTVTGEQRAVLVQVQKLMAAEKRDEAIKLLQGSALTKASGALTFNLANLYLESGNLNEAVAAYESAIKAYPSFRRAHRNLGLARVRAEELDQAIVHLSEAVRLGDSEGLTYGLLGYCRLSREEFSSALQAYRLAQLTEPEVIEWLAGIAQCLQQLGQQAEAIALLEEVIRKRPLESSYIVLKANIHLQLEQEDKAAKSLEMAHRLGTLSADPTLLLAELHMRNGRVGESTRVMEAAFSKADKPGESSILRLLQISVAHEQWLLAKRLLARVPEKGQSRSLRLLKAKYFIGSGEDVPTGAKLLEQLTREDPTDAEALLAHANQLAIAGQSAAAELIYERAAVDEDWAFKAFTAMTRLRASQGRYQAALKSLEKALALHSGPDLEAYRAALQRTLEASR